MDKIKMKRKLALLLLAASFLTAFATRATFGIIDKKKADSVKQFTHVIRMSSFSGKAGCSATAIGPHALLTATHCEVSTNTVTVDGFLDLRITSILRDESDHSILIVTGPEFKFAEVAPEPRAKDSEEVFAWGNPGGFLFKLRFGTYNSDITLEGKVLQLFDMWGDHGDSGAAIFNSKCQIIGVVSLLVQTNVPVPPSEKPFKGLGGFVLRFPASVYEEVRK